MSVTTETRQTRKQLKIPPLTEAEITTAANGKPEVIRIARAKLRTASVKIRGISPVHPRTGGEHVAK